MKTIEQQIVELDTLIARRREKFYNATDDAKEPARQALQAAIDAKAALMTAING